jgi:hypothetical protein
MNRRRGMPLRLNNQNLLDSIIAISGDGQRIKNKNERFLDKAFTHDIVSPERRTEF